jgi:hypothetical protein
MRRLTATLLLAASMLLTAAPAAFGDEPTCSGVVGENHGQHVIGDYVTGGGHDVLGWPPAGEVGDEVGDGDGVSVAGGPGPGFHFTIEGLAPGASFCTDRADFTTPEPFTP